mmetsp:Transcript_8121/g.15518  ORF Transcript_8121/g.15518 Transcript_8121/m.15518 type:complete len:128 (+) Transcript_8121:230-613(+)
MRQDKTRPIAFADNTFSTQLSSYRSFCWIRYKLLLLSASIHTTSFQKKPQCRSSSAVPNARPRKRPEADVYPSYCAVHVKMKFIVIKPAKLIIGKPVIESPVPLLLPNQSSRNVRFVLNKLVAKERV